MMLIVLLAVNSSGRWTVNIDAVVAAPHPALTRALRALDDAFVEWCLLRGEAELDGQRLEPFTLYVLAPGHEARLSSAGGGRAMLLGGQAYSTRRYVFWNFVSSSRDRIDQAKDDWKAQRFPLIPGDDQEFIPLPEVPTTVSYP